MGVWQEPTESDLYTDVLDKIKSLAARAATLMNINVDNTDVPDGSIKWDTAGNRFEVWNAGWKELRDTSDPVEKNRELYNINVSMLGGFSESSYRDASLLKTGILPTAVFNNTSHGVITSSTAHNVATGAANGFMSSAHYTKLNDGSFRTNDEIGTAYNLVTNVITSGDLSDATTKRITGAALSSFIEAKLAAGVESVTFKGVYDRGPTDIDVSKGQYQKLNITNATTLTFKTRTTPYTMYLYITSNGYTVTVPPGKWSGGPTSAPTINSAGVDLLTVNFDGNSFYYMLLANMS